MAKLHVKKGDTVKVIAGNQKGKTGVVTKVLVNENRAVVEGLNIVSKHKKPSASNPNGGIDKVEAPIHLSNLAVTTNGEITKVGRKEDKDGSLKRYSKKSGEFI